MITSHSVQVTVVEDEVVDAILDGRWDELKMVAIPQLDPDGQWSMTKVGGQERRTKT